MTVAPDLEADLARWHQATAALVAHTPTGLDGPDAALVHRRVRSACDQVLAFAARLLVQVEADDRWSIGGARTFAEWAAGQRGSSVGAARAEVALGRALDGPLPAATAAVQAGRMTLEHAQVLARFAPTSDARRAALASELPDRNEGALVAKAQRMGVDEYRRVVKRWAAAVDSDAHEREHQAACAAERLVFARRDNGVAFEGFLTVEHGDVLLTALRSVAGVPAKDDARSPDERRAAALTDLARLVLDRGMSSGGVQVRPHVSVHVSWEAFQKLAERSAATEGADAGGGPLVAPPELDDGEPIAPSVLARIACDSEITRIVFGSEGRPLDVGRAQRTFTGPQRRAVIARDRACRYPGCGAAPMLGEVHHVRWWRRDNGPTSVGNGILLCWYHHDLVHQRNLAIRWGAGGWEFRKVDGSVVRPPGAPGDPPGLSDGSGGAPPGAARSSQGMPPGGDEVRDWPGGSRPAPPDQGQLVLAGWRVTGDG